MLAGSHPSRYCPGMAVKSTCLPCSSHTQSGSGLVNPFFQETTFVHPFNHSSIHPSIHPFFHLLFSLLIHSSLLYTRYPSKPQAHSSSRGEVSLWNLWFLEEKVSKKIAVRQAVRTGCRTSACRVLGHSGHPWGMLLLCLAHRLGTLVPGSCSWDSTQDASLRHCSYPTRVPWTIDGGVPGST